MVTKLPGYQIPQNKLSIALLLVFGCFSINSAWSGQPGSATDDLHLLNRITFGPTAASLTLLKHIGKEAYIKQQLNPESIPESQPVLSYLSSADAINLTPIELFKNYGPPAISALGMSNLNNIPSEPMEPAPNEQQSDSSGGKKRKAKALQEARKELFKEIGQQTTTAKLMRVINSPRQLQEIMTDFWFNHFNVSINKGLDHIWVGAYEQQAIRPYALGKFRDLLEATSHHPAMLFYLDNWQNTAPGSPGARGKMDGLNENYARELMELHTLGVTGGYTQQDVVELARILTGLGLPPRGHRRYNTGGFGRRGPARAMLASINGSLTPANNGQLGPFGSYFDPNRHDFGDKLFLGNKIKGSGADEIEQALDILARSPATAHHISYELAQYFVSDNPSNSLVNKLAAKFTQSNGSIREVMNELLHSSEFWDKKYYNAKFKNPLRYTASALRAANTEPQNFRPILGFLQMQGMQLYGCLTPDGYKNTTEAWLNPDALLRRMNFATAVAASKLPSAQLAPIDFISTQQLMSEMNLGDKTATTIANAPNQMKVALFLGSPEFMRY